MTKRGPSRDVADLARMTSFNFKQCSCWKLYNYVVKRSDIHLSLFKGPLQRLFTLSSLCQKTGLVFVFHANYGEKLHRLTMLYNPDSFALRVYLTTDDPLVLWDAACLAFVGYYTPIFYHSLHLYCCLNMWMFLFPSYIRYNGTIINVQSIKFFILECVAIP